ncbi:MAG: hypothetical protein N2Z22_02525 [Turneriella sp.]|nr:hypothetical protein [Leptospiraceae bacterium]MCX7632191.1 hypothetical protein [Turneriella sp.]
MDANIGIGKQSHEDRIRELAHAALPPGCLLHKIGFFYNNNNMRIVVELDKPADPYGSVNIGDCETFSRGFAAALDALETTLGTDFGYSLEVSSIGAERELTSLADIERFRSLPMQVTYQQADGKLVTEILTAQSVGSEAVAFTLADCKANRKKYGPAKLRRAQAVQLQWSDIRKIRLHLDM